MELSSIVLSVLIDLSSTLSKLVTNSLREAGIMSAAACAEMSMEELFLCCDLTAARSSLKIFAAHCRVSVYLSLSDCPTMLFIISNASPRGVIEAHTNPAP